VRIPFPERLPIHRVAIVAVVFFAIQRMEGTTFFFATACESKEFAGFTLPEPAPAPSPQMPSRQQPA